jgi:hypothetical protein
MTDSIKLTNIYVLDKEIINDPMFDLIPGKHGHFLDKNGKIQKINGARMTVHLLDVNPTTLFQIADFVDDMDSTHHTNVTIITKEANKIRNILSKIGVFAI